MIRRIQSKVYLTIFYHADVPFKDEVLDRKLVDYVQIELRAIVSVL